MHGNYLAVIGLSKKKPALGLPRLWGVPTSDSVGIHHVGPIAANKDARAEGGMCELCLAGGQASYASVYRNLDAFIHLHHCFLCDSPRH